MSVTRHMAATLSLRFSGRIRMWNPRFKSAASATPCEEVTFLSFCAFEALVAEGFCLLTLILLRVIWLINPSCGRSGLCTNQPRERGLLKRLRAQSKDVSAVRKS